VKTCFWAHILSVFGFDLKTECDNQERRIKFLGSNTAQFAS
jgi:hypothetical protein